MLTLKIISTLLLFIVVNVLPNVDAKILGAFVFPHGGIALNPSGFQSPDRLAEQNAWKIHLKAVDVGRYIRDLRPDVIFLSTPHGVADMRNFAIYLNAVGNGTAETDNCKCPPCCYDLSVNMDVDLASSLVTNLSSNGLKVTGFSFFGPPGDSEEPALLKWGELIPLLFIRDIGTAKIVVMSHPSERYNKPVEMKPELLQLGKRLHDIFESMSKKVVIIVSSDLAHTHDANGPYGFSTAAEPFDKACGHWAKTLHPTYILDTAADYVEKAMSCGYTGLVMLHGLLDAGKLSSWNPVLYANYHPSYYGMLVASFTKNGTVFH